MNSCAAVVHAGRDEQLPEPVDGLATGHPQPVGDLGPGILRVQDHLGRHVLPHRPAVCAQPHQRGRGQLPVPAGSLHAALLIGRLQRLVGLFGRVLNRHRGCSVRRRFRCLLAGRGCDRQPPSGAAARGALGSGSAGYPQRRRLHPLRWRGIRPRAMSKAALTQVQSTTKVRDSGVAGRHAGQPGGDRPALTIRRGPFLVLLER